MSGLKARPENIGPHHLIVFMLEHMAVPNKASRLSHERYDDARHLSRRADDRVFPSTLFRFCFYRLAGEHDF